MSPSKSISLSLSSPSRPSLSSSSSSEEERPDSSSSCHIRTSRTLKETWIGPLDQTLYFPSGTSLYPFQLSLTVPASYRVVKQDLNVCKFVFQSLTFSSRWPPDHVAPSPSSRRPSWAPPLGGSFAPPPTAASWATPTPSELFVGGAESAFKDENTSLKRLQMPHHESWLNIEFCKTTGHTVCPKVPYISKVTLFSAKCGWILKPFGLLIAPAGGFDLVYEVTWLLTKWP